MKTDCTNLYEQLLKLRKEYLGLTRKLLEVENALLRQKIQLNVDNKNKARFEIEDIEDKINQRLPF